MTKILTVVLWPFTKLFLLALGFNENMWKWGFLPGCLASILAAPLWMPLIIVAVFTALLLEPMRLIQRRRTFAHCSAIQRERLIDFVGLIKCLKVNDRTTALFESRIKEEDAQLLKRRMERCVAAGIPPQGLASFVPTNWRTTQEQIARMRQPNK